MYSQLQGEEDCADVPHSTPITPGGSLYITQSDVTDTSVEESFDHNYNAQSSPIKPVDALNEYLHSRDASPIRSSLSTPWEIVSERTKRYYVRKASQSVTAIMEDIAPESPAQLFQAMCSSRAVQQSLSSDDETEVAVDGWMLLLNATMLQQAGRLVAKFYQSWLIKCRLINFETGYLTCQFIGLQRPNATA